jgi:hypothetical protein
LPDEFGRYNLDFLGGFFIEEFSDELALVRVYEISGDLLDYYN